MKYYFLPLFLVLFTTAAVSSQSSAADGVTRQKERESSLLTHTLNDRTRADGRDDITRISSTGTVEERLTLERIRLLYRNPTGLEQKAIAPEAEDISTYAELLKNKNFGLFRLLPDAGCDDATFQTKRSDICDLLTIPGGGAGFSFRTRTHRQLRFADLIYDGRSFLAFGQGSQGFLANIGDLQLDRLNDSSPGLKFMTDFVPATQFEKIKEQNLSFSNRVIDGDHVYSKVVPAKMNVTYLLRSIAYKAYVAREFEGVRFNELSFDKRTDVLVAFRVVRTSPDGSVTLLWRELRNIDSPRIIEKK